MTPFQTYEFQLDQGILEENEEQYACMQYLEKVYNNLIQRQKIRNSQLGKLRRSIKPRPPIQGLYLWGDVGVGKTYLIDLFYEQLPVKKMRIHFHAFMRNLHEELKKHQGQKNPLDIIAKDLADEYLVICFDEFFVSNITDAMLLGELFKALFKGGICLITSSNIPPNELYKNGLQRERFLPAIALIERYTKTIHLNTIKDYRRTHIEKAGIYYTPLDISANENLKKSFTHFAKGAAPSTEKIELLGRSVEIIKQAGKVIWFNFNDICGRPRSQNDYLELVKHYDVFLISNVPILKTTETDLVVSFINLIDILYDAHKALVISAATTPDQLYPEGCMKFEFQRTRSRLIDMQSTEYLGNA